MHIQMTIEPLSTSHFSLLLTWLTNAHVKEWWDKDTAWTLELIAEKYQCYVDGYKIEKDHKKPMQAYVFCVDFVPTGYIQLYNAYDFEREPVLRDLPCSLAALDIFIGDELFLGKGIGSFVIDSFVHTFCMGKYDYIFVDPNKDNTSAIKCFEKAGFKKTREVDGAVWMLRQVN